MGENAPKYYIQGEKDGKTVTSIVDGDALMRSYGDIAKSLSNIVVARVDEIDPYSDDSVSDDGEYTVQAMMPQGKVGSAKVKGSELKQNRESFDSSFGKGGWGIAPGYTYVVPQYGEDGSVTGFADPQDPSYNSELNEWYRNNGAEYARLKEEFPEGTDETAFQDWSLDYGGMAPLSSEDPAVKTERARQAQRYRDMAAGEKKAMEYDENERTAAEDNGAMEALSEFNEKNGKYLADLEKRAGNSNYEGVMEAVYGKTSEKLDEDYERLRNEHARLQKAELDSAGFKAKRENAMAALEKPYDNIKVQRDKMHWVSLYDPNDPNAGYYAYENGESANEDERNLGTAEYFLNDAKNTLKSNSTYWGGWRYALNDPNTYRRLYGAANEVNLRLILDEAQKLADQGKGWDSLPESARAAIEAWNQNITAHDLMDPTRGWQFNSAQSTAQSVRFMVDMAISMGITKAAGRVALESMLSKGLLKGVERDALKDAGMTLGKALGKSWASTAVKKGGGQVIEKTGVQFVRKELANLGWGVVEGAGQTILSPGQILKGFADNLITFDDKGNLPTYRRAFWNSDADNAIEIWSENGAEPIWNMITRVPASLSRLAARRFLPGAYRTMSEFFTKASASGFVRMLKAAGYQGQFEEMFEELAGAAARYVTGVDKDELRDFFTWDNMRTLGISFLPITMLGGVASMAHVAVADGYYKKQRAGVEGIMRSLGYNDSQIAFYLNAIKDDPSQGHDGLLDSMVTLALEEGAVSIDDEGKVNFKGEWAKLLDSVGKYRDAAARKSVFDGAWESEQNRQRREDYAKAQEEYGGDFLNMDEYGSQNGSTQFSAEERGLAEGAELEGDVQEAAEEMQEAAEETQETGQTPETRKERRQRRREERKKRREETLNSPTPDQMAQRTIENGKVTVITTTDGRTMFVLGRTESGEWAVRSADPKADDKSVTFIRDDQIRKGQTQDEDGAAREMTAEETVKAGTQSLKDFLDGRILFNRSQQNRSDMRNTRQRIIDTMRSIYRTENGEWQWGGKDGSGQRWQSLPKGQTNTKDGLWVRKVDENGNPIKGEEMEFRTWDEIYAMTDKSDGLPSELPNDRNADAIAEEMEEKRAQTEAMKTPLEKLDKDGDGNPVFESADSPATAWDAMVEYYGGDAAGAAQDAQDLLKQKQGELSKLEEEAKKSPKGSTMAEKRAAREALASQLEAARKEVDFWQSVVDEAQRREDERAAENAKAESERQEGERQSEQQNGEKEAPKEEKEAPKEETAEEKEAPKEEKKEEAPKEEGKSRREERKEKRKEAKEEKKEQRQKKAEAKAEGTIKALNTATKDRSMSMKDFADAVREWAEKSKLPIRVISSPAELEEIGKEHPDLKAAIDEVLANGSTVHGFAHEGTAYLYAPGLWSAWRAGNKTAGAVVAHEAVAHIGLKSLLDGISEEESAKFYDEVYASLSDEKERDRWCAYQWNFNMTDSAKREALGLKSGEEVPVWSEMTAEQKKSVLEGGSGDAIRRGAADEYMADIAEQLYGNKEIDESKKSLWRRIVEWVEGLFGKGTLRDEDLADALYRYQKERMRERSGRTGNTRARETGKKEAAAKAEPEVAERGEVSGEEARKAGKWTVNGHTYTRQESHGGIRGAETEVVFGEKNGETKKGRYVLVPRNSIQASHTTDGQRNPMHFIPEAQPKDRSSADSGLASGRIGSNLDPERVTIGKEAYVGAPVINTRGEVIQGNNRTIGMQKADSANMEAYHNWLREHAEEFGFTPEQVDRMGDCVLAREIDVDDKTAIDLGQKTAQDTESGGRQQIDSARATQGLQAAGKFGDFIEALLTVSEDDEGMSLTETIRKNAKTALSMLSRLGLVNNTQINSAYTKSGEINESAVKALTEIVQSVLFEGGNLAIQDDFNKLPNNVKNALLQTVWRATGKKGGREAVKAIQEAVRAYRTVSDVSGELSKTKDIDKIRDIIQTAFVQGDMFTGRSDGQGLSEAAKRMAERFYLAGKGLLYSPDGTKLKLKDVMNRVFDNMEGRRTMFEETEPMSYADAVEEAFNSDPTQRFSAEERNEETEERTEGKGYTLSDELDENGIPFIISSDGSTTFGEIGVETGLTPAPIKLSEGKITDPETNEGYGLVHIEARHGEQIRKAGYKDVVSFIEDVARNWQRIRKGNKYGESQSYLLELKDKHNNTLIVELSRDKGYWNINTAGIFNEGYSRRKEEVFSRPAATNQPTTTGEVTQSATQNGSEVTETSRDNTHNASTSENKGSENSATSKENATNFSAEERAAVEELRANGVEVITDTAETERVLDEMRKESDTRFLVAGERSLDNIDKDEAEHRMANLGYAQDLEEEGKNAGEIFAETGWQRGADGLWRYEIGDPHINEDVLMRKESESENEYYQRSMRLEDVLTNADDLFEKYPQLKDIKVTVVPTEEMGDYTYGNFDFTDNRIDINGYFTKPWNKKYETQSAFLVRRIRTREIMLHEVQHAIQEIEGFARGGNRKMQISAADKDKVKEWKKQMDKLDDEKRKIERQENRVRAEKKEGWRKELNRLNKDYWSKIDEENRLRLQIYAEEDKKRGVYDQLTGEVEARNVVKRASMPYRGKARTLLESTEDVTRKDQIILRNGIFYDINNTPLGRDVWSPLQTSDGEVYGFVKDGKVYLGPNAGSIPASEWSRMVDSVMREREESTNSGETKFSAEERGYATDKEIAEAGKRFDEELQRQIDGKLSSGHVYQLGNPGRILIAAGFPNLPIELEAKHLEDKASQRNHEYDISDLKGLVQALNTPIAVFKYGDETKAENVIVELERDGKKFVVGVHFNIEHGGILVNSIRGLFNKNNWEWLNWVNQGKLKWVDKKKIQDLISKQQTNLADVTYLTLDNATKVIQDFDNPSLPGENSSDFRASAEERELSDADTRFSAEEREINETVNAARERLGVELTPADMAAEADAASLMALAVKRATEGGRIPNMSRSDENAFYMDAYRNASKDREVRREGKKETIKGIQTELYEAARDAGFDMAGAVRDRLADLAMKDILGNGELTGAERGWLYSQELALAERLGVDSDTAGYVLWNRANGGNDLATRGMRSLMQQDSGLDTEGSEELAEKAADVRFSASKQKEGESAATAYDMRMRSVGRMFSEQLENEFSAIDEMVKAIETMTGKKVARKDDPSLAFNQLTSKTQAGMKSYISGYLAPMWDEIARVTKNTDLSFEDVMKYLHLKHGLERNEAFHQRAVRQAEEARQNGQNVPDPERRDYSGLTARYKEHGGDIAAITAAAEAELGQLEQRLGAENADALWDRIRAATERTLDIQVETGLISAEQRDRLRDEFNYYIPLQGFDEEANPTNEDKYAYQSEWDARETGDINKAAKGRRTMPANPITAIAAQAQRSIVAGERNMAKRAIYDFVQDRQDNDLATLGEVWYVRTVDDEGNEVYKQVVPDLSKYSTPEERAEAVKEWEEKMKANPNAVRESQRLSLPGVAFTFPKDAPQHVIEVRIGGELKRIYINGDPRVAQVVNGQISSVADNAWYKGIAWITRGLSGFYTTFNPEFFLTNFLRDMQFAAANIFTKENGAYQRAFARNLARAFRTYTLSGKYKKGTLDLDDRVQKLYEEFASNGGITGYSQTRSNEDFERMLTDYIKGKKGFPLSPSRMLNALMDGMESFTSNGENIARFAAYMTSRQMGRGIRESVADAKDVTVNFNRRGSTHVITADEARKLCPNSRLAQGAVRAMSGVLSTKVGYAFFNVSVQGIKTWVNNTKKHPAKAAAVYGAYMLSGLLPGFIHGALSAMAGGDAPDPEEWYWNIPEHTRRNNIIIGIGNGRYIKIPLPQEIAPFHALGDIIATKMAHKDAGDNNVWKALESFADMLPLNPVSDGGFWQSVMPTGIAPITDVLLNKDYRGMSIHPDYGKDSVKPKWQQAYGNTAGWAVTLSRLVSKATGGDDFVKGRVEISPEDIEHVVTGYLGGVFSFANRIEKTVESMWDEDERVETRSIPFVNRVIGDSGDFETGSYLTKAKNYAKGESEEVKAYDKGYKENRMKEERRELRTSPEYQLSRTYKRVDKQLSNIDKRISRLERQKANADSREEKLGIDEKIKELKARKNRLKAMLARSVEDSLYGE